MVKCRICDVTVLADGDTVLIHDPDVPHPDDGASHLRGWATPEGSGDPWVPASQDGLPPATFPAWRKQEMKRRGVL